MVQFEWHPGESLQEDKPEEVIFNPDGVILRRNFKKVYIPVEEGEPLTGWTYEYTNLTNSQYERYSYYQSEAENDLTQLEASASLYEELLKTQENQQAMMEGLADLYESNMEVS